MKNPLQTPLLLHFKGSIQKELLQTPLFGVSLHSPLSTANRADQKPIFPSSKATTFPVVPHFAFAKWRHFWEPALSLLAHRDPTFNTQNTKFPFWRKLQVWGGSPHLSKGCFFHQKIKKNPFSKKKALMENFSAPSEEKKPKEHRALFAVSEELLLHQRGSLHMKEVLKYESDLWTSQKSGGRESS